MNIKQELANILNKCKSRKGICVLSLVLSLVVLMLLFIPARKHLDGWNRITTYKQLRIGVILNPMEYYISQGKTSGFSYELGQMIADSMGVEAIFQVYYTYEDAYLDLLEEEIDLLAAADCPNLEWGRLFSYTEPLFYTDIISVKPKKKREPALKTADTVVDKNIMAISLPMILIDQAADYILNSDTTVHLKYCTAVSDQLLQEVEEGRYDVTLTFGLYWRAYAYLFPHLKTADILRDSVPLCWVIRRDNDSLLQHCNNFLLGQQQKNRYRQLLKKYCDPESAERSYLASVQHLSPFGAVSRYDNQLQKYAEKYNLDWCLLAALIYQESRFKSNVVGRGNTFGLMQFKPATGSKYGVYASASAAQQIEGGCRYLNSLRQMLEKQGIRDSSELVSMMIAAYNAGSGHIKDAIAIAKAEGWDATVWSDNVEKALLCLNEHSYYHKDYVKSGRYKSGRHTIHYVQSILLRRDRYKSLVERNMIYEVK